MEGWTLQRLLVRRGTGPEDGTQRPDPAAGGQAVAHAASGASGLVPGPALLLDLKSASQGPEKQALGH